MPAPDPNPLVALNNAREEIEAEVVRLRKRNSELHRRCQQAEAAVEKFKRQWDENGGPRGGSFGRALLASYCTKLENELEAK